MFGLDELIQELAAGGGLLVVLAVALLLGLRHATDPDHLAAVSMLIASSPGEGARRAGVLGMAWGIGHATTLFAFGLPVVVFGSYLPDPVEAAAEAAVGILIMALALRLLVRWRRGHFHAHLHRHGDVAHRHLHPHERDHGHAHRHDAERRLGRSPLQALGIGLVHGVGGSAGVGVLLLAGIADEAQAVSALVVFAIASALAMAWLSWAFGLAITRGPVLRRALALAPALGTLTFAFGAWYALAAFDAVAYPL